MSARRPGRDPAARAPEDEARLYGRALRLLAAHDRSAADLRKRLARHGEAATVERVIARLADQGYLDDSRFAQAYTSREALERGAGARLVRANLRAHGVAEAVVGREAERAASAELETARAFARRVAPRLRDLEEPVQVRRLAGQLARRGYAPAVVYRVVRETVHALGEEAQGALDALAQMGDDPGESEEPDA